ncbi:EcsC family protein [Bacillus sp. 2205SS5-2]|uniref:EcsC family protein n=1 Tax=Bacillus sp. 2205SS5-2 TaxID=3109031 RepID=UPI00300425AE
MQTYFEEKAKLETDAWKKRITKKPGMISRYTKQVQSSMHKVIPEKAQDMVTESIKKMIEVTLFGSEYTTKSLESIPMSLEGKERRMLSALQKYQKTAALEGAGTGAGGILLGLADFPLLLAIKMKYLFHVSAIYGYSFKSYEERLFLLFVFQLAFSNGEHRLETLRQIEGWEEKKAELISMDWQVLQQEYRDHIDLVKMFQMLPGFGAVVGAIANYQLLDHLGETAIHAFRIRYFLETG